MLRKQANSEQLNYGNHTCFSCNNTSRIGTFGNNAQGQGNQTQGNVTVGNVTLTPQQKDAICNPNNPSSKLNPVNTTESRICGIPKTLHTNSTSSNMTTGEETPPSASSIAPSANTTTGMETETPPSNLAPSATPPED